MRKQAAVPRLIVTSDLHLSHEAPVARQERGHEWYGVMENYLHQLYSLATDLNVPVVVAGDVFHRWNPGPELINFVMKRMPKVWAIPGQHDLPHHNLQDIKKSAYWTLVQAGVINHMNGQEVVKASRGIYLSAFPWGCEISRAPKFDGTHIAICHHYIWQEGHSFPGAPPEYHAIEMRKLLRGYDAAFFGDNHKPFWSWDAMKNPVIVNCGSFLRRNSDEIDHKPAVWVYQSDNTIYPHYLDTSMDKIIPTIKEVKGKEIDAAEFIKMLKDMDVESLDFKETLRQWSFNPANKLTPACVAIITTILGEV